MKTIQSDEWYEVYQNGEFVEAFSTEKEAKRYAKGNAHCEIKHEKCVVGFEL